MSNFDTFIFVPSYNVEKKLKGVLEKIPPSVRNRSKILVIDDGSTDGTGDLDWPSLGAGVEYFRFEKNQGYGVVVKKGLKEGIASGARFVVCLHGDGQYPADMLDQFLSHLETNNLSILQGSRRLVPENCKAGHMPLHKRMGGTFLTFVENIVFRQKLTDRHSGFILYRTDFLKTLKLDCLSRSFDIDLEILSIADAKNFAIGELPIPTVYDDEKSNLNVVNYGLRVLRQVFCRMFAN